jgi:exopolysaccharide biosynthesis WecB/TagA/CpsF family protein
MQGHELDVSAAPTVTDTARRPNARGPAAPSPDPAPPDARVPERELLGVPFAMLEPAAVARLLRDRPAGAPFVYVATPNAHHLVLLHRGAPGFVWGLSRAWFLTCDSRVLRHLGRLLFGRPIPVVTGSDLTLHLLRHVIGPDDPVTIIGGDEALAQELGHRFGLSRVALYSPPFGFGRDPVETRRCVEFVLRHPGRFIFLACGAPQSEVLAARIAEAGASGIGLCVGASLLFATGQLKRAPRVWQALSLEWLHRLLQEPRLVPRLWRTQLPVLAIAARAWLSRRAANPHASLLDRPRLSDESPRCETA